MTGRKSLSGIGILLFGILIVFSCKNELMNVLESPEIAVFLNGVEVKNGKSIRLELLELGAEQTYTVQIKNRGQSATLNLNGALPVEIGGNDYSLFTISPPEQTSLPPGGSVEFPLTFRPAGFSGDKELEIIISSDDKDEGSFSFTLIAPTENAAANFDAPGVVLTSSAGTSVNTAPIPVTATFTEEVVDFTLDDITVAGGHSANLSTTDNRVFVFEITNPVEGTVSAYIAQEKVRDRGGRTNTSSNLLALSYDETVPTVSLISDNGSPTSLHPIPITITFSEPVLGFVKEDVSLSAAGVILSELMTTDSRIYTATLDTEEEAREITLSIAAGAAMDAAGNLSTALSEQTIVYDASTPAITISSTASLETKENPIPLTFTFSEEITGLETGDITVNPGGTLMSLSTEDDIIYTAELKNPPEGEVNIYIAAGAVTDLSGRGNSPSNLFTLFCDRTKPEAVIAAPDGIYHGDEPINLLFTFNEEVIGFDASDVTLSEGTLTILGTEDNNIFTAVLDLEDTVSITDVDIDIPAGAAADAAGNGSEAAESLTIHYNSNTPTVIISSESGSFVNTPATTITIEFSQAIQDFDFTTIRQTGNAALENYQNPTANRIYTFDATFDENPETTTFYLAGGLFKTFSTPIAFNEKSNDYTLVYDAVPPTGTLTIDGGNSYSNDTTVNLSLTADDGSGTGVYEMQISNDSDFSSGTGWIIFEESVTGWSVDEGGWDINTGTELGEKTVYCMIRDRAGNESETILIDTITVTRYGRIDISVFDQAVFE